jgi:plastocyanin
MKPGVATILAALSLAAPVSAQDGATGAPQSGRISGTITLSPTIASRKMRFRLYADLGPGAVPRREAADLGELTNVVVYLEAGAGLGATGRAPAHPLVITQRDETFLPHVLPVVRGSTVSFRNDDPYYHNVFSLAKAKTFDLGRFPQGQNKTVRFDRPGIVQVFCHIHADMSAVVLVLDHPHFAVPDAGGRYELAGIPPGDYRVVAWHERARSVVRSVRVAAGETTALDLSVPIPDAVASR